MKHSVVRWLLLFVCGLPPGLSVAEPVFDGQRLFTTAAERARLDHDRGTGMSNPEADPEISRGERRTPLRARGYVRRDGGPDTAWVERRGSVLTLPAPRLHAGRIAVEHGDGAVEWLRPGETREVP